MSLCITPEYVFDDSVNTFRLTIRFRVVRRGHVQFRPEEDEESTPKVGRETRVSIGHQVVGHTMKGEDSVIKYAS